MTTLKKNTIVLAKLKGYPAWPAYVRHHLNPDPYTDRFREK